MNKNSNAIRLSLCMIVRDNETTIGPCLESIRPWVDEMVIVDTGSKDATKDIVRSYGARLFEIEWIDDFSAARNESISRAQGEWIFWMDSDDTIPDECGKKLRQLVETSHKKNVLGYVMQVRCPSSGNSGINEFTEVDHVKMFRNHPQIRFEGRIHEQVLMPIRNLGGDVDWTDIYVVHSGAKHDAESQRRKTTRDLRILEKDLAERPNHPFILFNFAMTYAELGEYEPALGWIGKCLAVSKPVESHVAKAFAYQTNCLFQLNRIEEALESCLQGRQHYPNDSELLFREGMIRHALEQYDLSIARYTDVLNGRTQHSFRSTDPGIEGFKCRFNLGVVFRDAGKFALAEVQWRMVLDEVPYYLPACRALGELLLQVGKIKTAEVFSSHLMQSDPSRTTGALLSARVNESVGRLGDAITILEAYAREYPDNESIVEEYCRLLFLSSDWEKSQIYLESLVELNPSNGAALHNLGLVFLNKGQNLDALAALKRSLEVRPESEVTQQLIVATQEALLA